MDDDVPLNETPYSPLARRSNSLRSESSYGSRSGDETPANRTYESDLQTARRMIKSLGMSTGMLVDPKESEERVVIAMTGLPARGKSYLSSRLRQYLTWLNYKVKVFNVGQTRRKYKLEDEDHSERFFDPNNEAAKKKREQYAALCLEDLIKWLKSGKGNVGIHDATNSTRERRQLLAKRIAQEKNIKLMFIESVCTDQKIIDANIAVKVRSGDPDYDGMNREKAFHDFRERIRHYEETYEPLAYPHDEDLTYCRIENVGDHVTFNHIESYLESRIGFFLTNLHLQPRSIFFTRHGESQFNVEGRIGGDAYLSTRGRAYAEALPKVIGQIIDSDELTVWTSTYNRTIETASHLPYKKIAWKALDELDAGVCDGMTYEEIEENYPEDFAARDDDKLHYRYRGGESYRDVLVRLEPVILELERQSSILVVCHQAVLRCIYAYYHNLSQEELPYINIPLHTIIKLTPQAYGCDEERFTVPIGAVDTLRPRPAHVKSSNPIDEVSPAMRRPSSNLSSPRTKEMPI